MEHRTDHRGEHPANTAQAEAWNGYEGSHWARNQHRWDAVNDGFNEPLLDAAALAPGHRVLDIGCGAGRTARLAARRVGPAGRVLGLDLSGPMLERARELARGEGVANVAFEQGDAQVHPLPPGTFDRAVSRYGVMFFGDPLAAFGHLGGALRPGGRLAFVCAAGPEGNEWLDAFAALRGVLPTGGFGTPGGPGMFSLADPDATTALLAAAGFEDIAVRPVRAYGDWGRTAEDAAAFLLDSGPGRHLLADAGPETATEALARLTAALRPHERDGAVRLLSTSWLNTATRH
ncbi:class I SAM-dependent methyltransferase [Streptomyces sp. NPDC002073]